MQKHLGQFVVGFWLVIGAGALFFVSGLGSTLVFNSSLRLQAPWLQFLYTGLFTAILLVGATAGSYHMLKAIRSLLRPRSALPAPQQSLA